MTMIPRSESPSWTYEKAILLDPDTVVIGWRARTDLGDIADLGNSINVLGQLQPILVHELDDGRLEVIAGARRLTACKLMRKPVAAWVLPRMDVLTYLDIQLEENIARKNFDRLEIAEGLAYRKQIYNEQFPEVENGAVGRRGNEPVRSKSDIAKGSGRDKPADRFTLDAAKRLGLSETRVRDIMKLADLPDDVKETVKSLPTTKERNIAIDACLKEQKIEAKKERLRAKIAEIKERESRSSNKDEENQDVAPSLFVDPRVEVIHASNQDWLAGLKGDVKFDLILTDPPYESGRKSIIRHDNGTDIKTDFGEWDVLDVKWVRKFHHLLPDGGQMLIFCTLEAIGDYKTVIESEGLIYRGALIWHKTNPGTVHRPVYLSACEAIVWATKGKEYHFKGFDNCGAPEVHNVIEGPICGGNERIGEHPTQKPLWIIERLLRRHATVGHRVLDPFAGMGTTAAACKRLGIGCTAIEQAELFYNTATLRVNATVPGEGIDEVSACSPAEDVVKEGD